MKNSPQIFNHCEILSRKLFVFSWCNCTPAAPGDYSQLIFSAAESSLVHIVVSHLKKKAFTTREVCSKRKAKPATNPDVHQTRQDCNCVLAIRMQRYTMYYYVVVMLLCCKWPLLALLQRLRVHWERKKNAVGKLQATTSCLSFLWPNLFRGGQRYFFSSFLPFSRKH